MIYKNWKNVLIIIFEYISNGLSINNNLIYNNILYVICSYIKKTHKVLPLTNNIKNSLVYSDFIINNKNKLDYINEKNPNTYTTQDKNIKLIYDIYKTYLDIYKKLNIVCCFSHNDLHKGNIIYDGKNVFIIDWNDATYNDNMYDLAYFIVISRINIENEKKMIKCLYNKLNINDFIRHILMKQFGRFRIMTFNLKSSGGFFYHFNDFLNQHNDSNFIDLIKKYI